MILSDLISSKTNLLDKFLPGLYDYLTKNDIQLLGITFKDNDTDTIINQIDEVIMALSVMVVYSINNTISRTKIVLRLFDKNSMIAKLPTTIVKLFLADLAISNGFSVKVRVTKGKYQNSIGEIRGKKLFLGYHPITNAVVEINLMSSKSLELVQNNTHFRIEIRPFNYQITDILDNPIEPGDIIVFDRQNLRYGIYVGFDLITHKHIVDMPYNNQLHRQLITLGGSIINLSKDPDKIIKQEFMLMKLEQTT